MIRKLKYTTAVADETNAAEPTITHPCLKRQQRTSSRYLPPEIVFQFLSHLPAQILLNVARHVCREWNHIIGSRDFARHHLRNSTGGGGLLIQDWEEPRRGFYLETRRARTDIREFNCGFDHRVWSSCNGLVLMSHGLSSVNYVANPLTKQLTTIPPFDGLIGSCSLAFVEGSMAYKVVRSGNKYPRIPVVTVGVDQAWRHIDIGHLLLSWERICYYSPMVTGGHVHWVFLTGSS